MKPPIAKRISYSHDIHGDVRHDDYYWLNEPTNPEVIKYLEDENKYYDEIMQPLKEQTEEIYQRMVDRVPESEVNVPIQQGPYFYYSRLEKAQQYPIYARKKAASREELSQVQEEILLDLNELAKASDYLSVTAQRMSTDHQHLAYLENRDGTDRFTAYVKDMETGKLLPDVIPNVFIYGSLEWSRCGDYLFYITVDDSERPSRLMRHRLGSDVASDELIYEEKETTFILHMNKSLSGQFIIVHAESKTTSEVRLIDADSPLSSPQLVEERRQDILYDVEHSGDNLLLLTNEEALNFQLQSCPLTDFQSRTNVIDYDEERFLQAIYPFQDTLLIAGRENGLTQLWELKEGKLEPLHWDEPLYSVSVIGDQNVAAKEILLSYESLLTPETTYGFNIQTGERQCLQVAPVSGHYERSDYHQEQLWATAEDGSKIPLMLVYHKDAFDNGPAPLILSAYGSYGANSDPYFSPYKLPILDKGVVFVTAQVRGGSEMGRNWYEDGKMQHKRNTFTDFIAAANHLLEQGYTTSSQLAGRGGSAGGLLAGAVANMAGDLFKVIVPEVPFVDVVTTMLDTSIPLTTLEWDEWGDPRKKEDYFYIKSYSPYDNVEAKNYPHMYVTTGLNDPRVGYFEPAKWVARLRDLKTDDNTLVLKTNMGAGHFGESGRFNQLKEVAEVYAFILHHIGTNADVKI